MRNTGRLVVSSVFCCVLCACVVVPDSGRLKSLDMITAEGLQAHVEFLADDALLGRRAGEPGYDEAAQFVAKQFEELGLVAGNGGWFQQVRLRRSKLVTEHARMSIHLDDEEVVLALRDDFVVSSDMVRSESSVHETVVFVGKGVHAPEFGYSDYGDVDVRGKVVAFIGGAPTSIDGDAQHYYRSRSLKIREASKRGAIGAIVIWGAASEKRRPWIKTFKNYGSRSSTTWVDENDRASNYYPGIKVVGRINMTAARRLFSTSSISFDEAYAAAELGESDPILLNAQVAMATGTVHETVSSANVIGVVPGTNTGLANEYLVYTAHLDHVGVLEDSDEEDVIHNGMYDNAMGVALMLETARAFAAAPGRRSALFIALTAEESGLLGSDFFVNNPTVPIESVVANINLDMPLFLHPLADLVAFGSQHSSLQSIAEAAAKAEGFFLSPDPVPEENLFARSDQYAFVRQGIPAVYLVSGFTSKDKDFDGEALYRDHLENHYHKPSDDLSRPVDWPSAVRFARAHTRIGFRIADDAKRPTWNKGDFYGRKNLR